MLQAIHKLNICAQHLPHLLHLLRLPLYKVPLRLLHLLNQPQGNHLWLLTLS